MEFVEGKITMDEFENFMIEMGNCEPENSREQLVSNKLSNSCFDLIEHLHLTKQITEDEYNRLSYIQQDIRNDEGGF